MNESSKNPHSYQTITTHVCGSLTHTHEQAHTDSRKPFTQGEIIIRNRTKCEWFSHYFWVSGRRSPRRGSTAARALSLPWRTLAPASRFHAQKPENRKRKKNKKRQRRTHILIFAKFLHCLSDSLSPALGIQDFHRALSLAERKAKVCATNINK